MQPGGRSLAAQPCAALTWVLDTFIGFYLTLPARRGQEHVQNLTNEDYFTYNSQTSPLDVRYFKGLGRTFRVGYRKSF